jgi:hypothetical protein
MANRVSQDLPDDGLRDLFDDLPRPDLGCRFLLTDLEEFLRFVVGDLGI